MPDPTGRISHLPDMHRGQTWKQAVNAASASNVPASYLAIGNALDGQTAILGSRWLLKDQTSASSNGIYEIISAPSNYRRAHDMDQDLSSSVPVEEVLGAQVYVIAGSSNSGTYWRTTNTTAPSIGTDDIRWAQTMVGGGGGSSANAELNIEGGQSVIKAHGAMGATETFDPTDGNVHSGTLDADCTFTLSAPSGSGAATLELYITGSGTHTWTWPGSVVWSNGTTPSAPGNAELKRVILETLDGGTTWYGTPVGGGSSSPLTTKGDLWTYSTTDARLAVGSNGTGVYADSDQTTGNRWTLQAIAGELLMQDGVSAPPIPLETDPTGDDWLYEDL